MSMLITVITSLNRNVDASSTTVTQILNNMCLPDNRVYIHPRKENSAQYLFIDGAFE